MFSAVRSFSIKATSTIPTDNSVSHYLGRFALSVGAAAISAGYSTLSTEEGRNLASNYFKNCFSGEGSHVVSGSDLDGS
jgi:hypothetical protein